jgi:hypothetical protein
MCRPDVKREVPYTFRAYLTLLILQGPDSSSGPTTPVGTMPCEEGRAPHGTLGVPAGIAEFSPKTMPVSHAPPTRNPKFKIRNSKFSLSLRCPGPPHASCSPAPPGATRAAGRPAGRAHANHPPADKASGCSSSSPLITEELKTISKEIRQLPLYRCPVPITGVRQ